MSRGRRVIRRSRVSRGKVSRVEATVRRDDAEGCVKSGEPDR
jgi:hypothetical protein